MSNVVPFAKKAEEKEAAEQPVLPPAPDAEPASAYAEFAVTTNLSFLRGASHPQDFIKQAMALGLAGIGIADRNSVAGVVRAYGALEEINERLRDENNSGAELPRLKLAVGARLIFADGTPDILAYPQNRKAWGRLPRPLPLAQSR